MPARARWVAAGPCAAVLTLLAVLPFCACGSNTSPVETTDVAHMQAMDSAGKWLRAEAKPFDTVEPTGSLDDLEPLRQIVGDARVVSLGEATHGTADFFKMKHRILRFLVERMGFTAFAIEATWPESNRVDDYVRAGQGDAAALLSGLYFWTWRTQEVLDMIQWMRSYNQAGGTLDFYGFDMQYPGMAITNVTTFVRAVDGNALSDFAQHFACLAAYANNSRGSFPSPGYGSQSQEYRDACRQDLQWVADTLRTRQAQYETASSEAAWGRALQSATVAIQYEEMTSNRRSRDEAMADNVKWLVDRMGPDGKIVLWAHNGHVKTANYGYPSMGLALRNVFHDQMVVMGFDFAHGTFNAVGQSGTTYTSLTTHTVGEPPQYSYEDYFLSADLPRFLLDLRNRDQQAGTPSWLSGPLPVRSIGSVYNDATPSSYLYQAQLPREYDVIIFLENTLPSQILPSVEPPAFDEAAGADLTGLVPNAVDGTPGVTRPTPSSTPARRPAPPGTKVGVANPRSPGQSR